MKDAIAVPWGVAAWQGTPPPAVSDQISDIGEQVTGDMIDDVKETVQSKIGAESPDDAPQRVDRPDGSQ